MKNVRVALHGQVRAIAKYPESLSTPSMRRGLAFRVATSFYQDFTSADSGKRR